MEREFRRPNLNKEQKARIKKLYKKNNVNGLLAILTDFFWIAVAVSLVSILSLWFLPLSILIIGSRQRALASLLHEAVHGTLFRTKRLNTTIGRFFCGWFVFQSFAAYKQSHVINHHGSIGNPNKDPDFENMILEGVYDKQTRSSFLWKYFLTPIVGLRTHKYIYFVINNRVINPLLDSRYTMETILLLIFHMLLVVVSIMMNCLFELMILWYLPYLTSFSIIGWYSELSEHYPTINEADNSYYSKNRYAAWYEKLFIGMHCDNLHLTHHLYPGLPFWNLKPATDILCEDESFKTWNDTWGGIFSSDNKQRTSLIKYVINHHDFEKNY
jgi:fatty acid desaturase